MSVTSGATALVILMLVALLPALVYVSWVRRAEHSPAGQGPSLVGAFLYGALFATITAGFLELIIVAAGTSFAQRYPGPEIVFLNGNSALGAFFLVLVIAPFVEEGLKASGVYSYRDRIRRPSDGPVVGAAVGLGFGFFETFLYGVGAFAVGGLAAGLTLILIRSISSVVLHGSSTGMFGHGFARSRFHQPGAGSGAYYLLAVGMHASFNALASLGAILAFAHVGAVAVDLASVIALFAAIAFAFGAIEHVRTVIQTSDYPALAGYRRGSGAPRAPPPKR